MAINDICLNCEYRKGIWQVREIEPIDLTDVTKGKYMAYLYKCPGKMMDKAKE